MSLFHLTDRPVRLVPSFAMYFIRLLEGSRNVFSCTEGECFVAVAHGAVLSAFFDREDRNIAVFVKQLPLDLAPLSLFHGESLFRVELRRSGRFVLRSSAGANGVVIVSPQLLLKGAPVHPDGLSVKTVVSRCLGPLSEWDSVLSFAGYTAIHFTPIQMCSGSAYCIQDHLKVGPPGGDWDLVGKVLRGVRERHLLFSDVVWNHMAVDAPFLLKHPHAGYSVSLNAKSVSKCNSPHLAPALALDLALSAITGFELSSESDVIRLLEHVNSVVWQSLALWEYFVLDVEATMAWFEPAKERALVKREKKKKKK